MAFSSKQHLMVSAGGNAAKSREVLSLLIPLAPPVWMWDTPDFVVWILFSESFIDVIILQTLPTRYRSQPSTRFINANSSEEINGLTNLCKVNSILSLKITTFSHLQNLVHSANVLKDCTIRILEWSRLGRTSGDHLVPLPWKKGQLQREIRSLTVLSSWSLNITRDGDFTACLASFQCLTTLQVYISFLISNRNTWCCDLHSLHLVLWLCTSKKSLPPPSLHPPLRQLETAVTFSP